MFLQKRDAEMLLYKRCPEEATLTLLQADPPNYYGAIKINITLFKWEKALDIALKSNAFVEVVLWHRKNLFESFGKIENSPLFKKLYDRHQNLDRDSILQVERSAQEEKA